MRTVVLDDEITDHWARHAAGPLRSQRTLRRRGQPEAGGAGRANARRDSLNAKWSEARGVFKFRSIAEAQAARERVTDENVARLRAGRHA
jgi:hypothetical protein